MAPSLGDSRPLTADESGVLLALLRSSFPGVEALRAQAATVVATPGCDCGCGTLDLIVTDPAAPRAAVTTSTPASLLYGDPDEPAGEVILFVAEGLLSSLEVTWWGDEQPPTPTPADLVPADRTSRS